MILTSGHLLWFLEWLTNVNWLESYSSWREKISEGLFFFWKNTKMIDVLVARLEQRVYGNNNAF